MTQRHLYFGIEIINMTAGQKATLVDGLRTLGDNSSGWPPFVNSYRPRLDGNAAIFEASFNDANLSITAIKNRLAAIFGVDIGDIGHSEQEVTYAGRATRVVTFDYNMIDRIRMAVFGYTVGSWPTWAESLLEVDAYIDANRVDWDGPDLG